MSMELVRKSLAIVDPGLFASASNSKSGHSKPRKVKNAIDLLPDSHKIIKKVNRKGQKEKVNFLSVSSKLTVEEARKKFKPKEIIVKENLEKLQVIRKASVVELDKEITSQLIERATTKRPIKAKRKQKEEKTVFTEEDFKKFEEEYFDE